MVLANSHVRTKIVILARLEAFLEPLGPILEPLGVVLGPLGTHLGLPGGSKIAPRVPKITPRVAKITPRGAKIAPRGPKKASRPAKMTVFIQKTDFAKSIEKQKENQRFWLLQPAQGRPKMLQARPR